VAADGTTPLTTVPVSVPLQQAASALFADIAGEDLFLLLNSGDTTVTAVNNFVTIGPDTYVGVIEDGPGNDTIIGAAGGSQVSYEFATSGVTVNLATGLATGGGGSDTLSNIRHVDGSNFADILIGDALNNGLFGNGGNDTLSGGLGDDFLVGGEGDDSLDGGDGVDTAQYGGGDGVVGVTVSLAIAGAQNTVGAGFDTLISIENLSGSDFNDTLTGDGGANFLFGGSGADTLIGGAGADNLDGADGDDILTAGAEGDDIIRVVSATAGAAYFGDNGVDTLMVLPGGIDVGGGFTFNNLTPATLSGIERLSFAETVGNTSVGVSFSQLATAPHSIVGSANQDVFTFFAGGGGAFSLAGQSFTLENWSVGFDFRRQRRAPRRSWRRCAARRRR
jgi:Ca2+-binding RTX toxin-like protein